MFPDILWHNARLDVFDPCRAAHLVVEVCGGQSIRVAIGEHPPFGIVGCGEGAGRGVHEFGHETGGRIIRIGLRSLFPFFFAFGTVDADFHEAIVPVFFVSVFRDAPGRIGISTSWPSVLYSSVIVSVLPPVVVLCVSSHPALVLYLLVTLGSVLSSVVDVSSLVSARPAGSYVWVLVRVAEPIFSVVVSTSSHML